MTIQRMLGLRQMLGRRTLLAAPVAAVGASAAPTHDGTAEWQHLDFSQCGGRDCTPPDDSDAALAASEQQGQLARLQSRCLALAQQLEARYQRYSWTEQLAADLRAIAHDTPPMGG